MNTIFLKNNFLYISKNNQILQEYQLELCEK